MRVEFVDPEEAEETVEGWREMTSWSARRILFDDGNEVIVFVYSTGPTPDHNLVEEHIDALSNKEDR